MTAIEKAKEISMGLAEDFADWMGPSWPMCGAQIAINKLAEMAEKRMIAALEAEKPAEDVLSMSRGILNTIKVVGVSNISAEKLSVMIGEYAEAYHAKRCAECKKVEPHKYYPLGQEPVEAPHA